MSLLHQTKLGFNGIEISVSIKDRYTMDSKTVHNIFDDNGKIVGQRSFHTVKMESELRIWDSHQNQKSSNSKGWIGQPIYSMHNHNDCPINLMNIVCVFCME